MAKRQPIVLECECCGAETAEPLFYEGYLICRGCRDGEKAKLTRMRKEEDRRLRP